MLLEYIEDVDDKLLYSRGKDFNSFKVNFIAQQIKKIKKK